jgi:hypothetical protein
MFSGKRGYPAVMAANCINTHRRPTPAQLRRFTVDGNRFSLALCNKHHRELMTALQQVFEPYLTAPAPRQSVKAGPTRVRKPLVSSGTNPTNVDPITSTIRQWARDNGLEVNVRGRLPERVLAAYEAQGPATPTVTARTQRVRAVAAHDKVTRRSSSSARATTPKR